MHARSYLVALGLLLVTPSLSRAQVPADLRAASRARTTAVAQADAATWDRLTADNFTIVTPSGKVLTKAERLALIKRQQPTSVTPPQHETIQASGTLAVQRFQGRDIWVTQVWGKDKRGWRVNAVQVTLVEPDSAAVRQAIDSIYTRYNAALKSGDAAGIAQMYTDDAIVMAPNFPAWQGRAAVNAGFAGFFGQFAITDVRLATRDVIVSGALAIEQGTYEWTLHPKTGADIKDNGKYLTVWQRQTDGSWKIVRDINNSDRPGAM